MALEIPENPCLVENILAFSYYNCPECNYRTKDEKVFEDHALESHPLSKEFFIKSEDEQTSEETLEINLPSSDSKYYIYLFLSSL